MTGNAWNPFIVCTIIQRLLCLPCAVCSIFFGVVSCGASKGKPAPLSFFSSCFLFIIGSRSQNVLARCITDCLRMLCDYCCARNCLTPPEYIYISWQPWAQDAVPCDGPRLRRLSFVIFSFLEQMSTNLR